jgi:hypothetical protein
MNKKDNLSRVSKAAIVRGAPIVVTTNDEFISFYDPSQFLVKDGGKIQYTKFSPGSPFASAFAATQSGTINDAAGNKNRNCAY